MKLSVLLVLCLALAMKTAAKVPDKRMVESRSSCTDKYPSWCSERIKRLGKFFICSLHSHMCKKSCGKCEEEEYDGKKYNSGCECKDDVKCTWNKNLCKTKKKWKCQMTCGVCEASPPIMC